MEIIEQTKQALEHNHLPCRIFPDKGQARQYILDAIKPGSTISVGGSVTIKDDLNLYPELAARGTFLNPYRDGVSKEEKIEIRKQALWVDYYLMSTNAITLEGELVNTDASGNRIAALALQFGPRHVFVVAGRNKIVKDREEAFWRIRHIAAPHNAKRLGRQTGCLETGDCVGCRTDERICCTTTITEFQTDPDRIEVILIDEDLGL
jgi:hypothetical protein